MEWKLPDIKGIVLEYDYLVGEDDKCGYLRDIGWNIGDVYGIYGEGGSIDLELLLTEDLYLHTLSNKGKYKLIRGGTELHKICSINL